VENVRSVICPVLAPPPFLVVGDGAVEVFHDDADVKERRKADGHGYPLGSMN
jgi:hypothetical protein